MADLDQVRHLEDLRDQYRNAADALAELALRIGDRLPTQQGRFETWTKLVEQNRDRTILALNQEIDAELRR
jgi:hypothetical protein